jgi:uncharacterized protein YlzI (FlbEa/FlbD family)
MWVEVPGINPRTVVNTEQVVKVISSGVNSTTITLSTGETLVVNAGIIVVLNRVTSYAPD